MFQNFRLVGCLALELCVDPSSRFVAIGTSDSQIKIYDLQKGFQTHNFTGHRGVIVKMQFVPQDKSLRLISAAEDMLVKVWDLVLNSEVCTIKPTKSGGRATCFAFSKDFKTLIIGCRDGSIVFLNAHNNFKLIHEVKCSTEIGFASDEEEVNSLVYLSWDSQTSYLAVGTTSGQIAVLDLATMEPCFLESDFIASETVAISHRKSSDNPLGQLVTVNMD